MKALKTIPRQKSDYKHLKAYLKQHHLIDERYIWFAGYDDTFRGARHAIATNLLYGYSRLWVISIHGEDVFILKNADDGFHVYLMGHISDFIDVISYPTLIFPSLEILTQDNDIVKIQVSKNIFKVRSFLKLVSLST